MSSTNGRARTRRPAPPPESPGEANPPLPPPDSPLIRAWKQASWQDRCDFIRRCLSGPKGLPVLGLLWCLRAVCVKDPVLWRDLMVFCRDLLRPQFEVWDKPAAVAEALHDRGRKKSAKTLARNKKLYERRQSNPRFWSFRLLGLKFKITRQAAKKAFADHAATLDPWGKPYATK